jgi:hypothetical protein
MTSQERIESEIVSATLGGPREPPVNLLRIARDIGVDDIRPTEFRNAFTDFCLPAPVIYVNYEESGIRRRFLLAHELAHVMLRAPEMVRLMRMRGSAMIDEEELADRIAATILVPDGLVKALRESNKSLERLEHVAQLAGVSLAMLIARMASSEIDVALLHWRRANCAWHVIDRPGAPPGLHGYVKPSMTGHWAIENLRHKESDVAVDCRVSGRDVRIGGRAYRRGRHVLQLIEPSRDIWIAPPGDWAHDRSEQSAVGWDMINRDADRGSAGQWPRTFSPVGRSTWTRTTGVPDRRVDGRRDDQPSRCAQDCAPVVIHPGST